VTPAIAASIEDHRAIEAALDRLASAVASGHLDSEAFRNSRDLLTRHYERESGFLAALAERDPALAAKLSAQHDEALEIAAQIEASLAAGQPADALYLARRLLAIAQHNIIEEERDVFPLFAKG